MRTPSPLSEPAAPAFVTFMQPDGTTPFTMTTTAAGEGSLDFAFVVPTVPTGTHFDVMFRVLDDLVGGDKAYAPTARAFSDELYTRYWQTTAPGGYRSGFSCWAQF